MKKTKLTELVLEYKKTKSNEIFNQIYSILNKIIEKKSTYLFYQKRFRGIKLCDTHLIDLDDIKQDLYLELLEKIGNFKSAKANFETYWFATLFRYEARRIINSDFYNQLKKVNNNYINKEGKEEDLIANIGIFKDFEEEIVLEDLFKNLTSEEIKILNILKNNPKLNQSQIAEIIGVNQSTISRIYNNLKNKCIK